ncbi:MAG: TauD/TfdA family dioxygenase [Alphaproteobacteria bacterium]|nr:TauD/TfdA family dioxygenase [Alphaproteobacteria bacterium]
MTLTISKLGDRLGAVAEGVDMNALKAGDAEALRGALLDNLVLCVRGQKLEPQAYFDAMGVFGKQMPQPSASSNHPVVKDLLILSSEDRDVLGDGKRIVVGAAWHTDDSYRAVPCSLTTLYGVEVPPTGGDTQFVNMYAAYDDLPDATKARIGPLRVVHKYDSSRKGNKIAKRTAEDMAAMPDVIHPMVRTHPVTGRKALYLNPNRMESVVGLARAESDALLDEMTAHATQLKYQYRHKWRQGDIVVWDNRCTMHKANGDYPQGARRYMLRVITEGTAPA